MSDSSDKDLKSEDAEAESKDASGDANKTDSSKDDNTAEASKKEEESGDNVNFLRDYLARSLGIKENPPQKLEELTLAGVAKYINSDECQNIVTMAGAGISTSAGIPDFRSPETGLYNNLASYNLPYPQAIFELGFFQENPRPFFVLAKELMPGSFKPTPCHYFINLLNQKGKLLRHYTQNIDTLERVAGLDPDKLVEAHGTFHTSHCLECRKEFNFPWMKEQVLADKLPTCDVEGCNGIVKPDIVFFGETLPSRFIECVGTDLPKCDLLIVMGTSLTVQPFASLVSRVGAEAPRLYINLEKGMTVSNPISALMFGGGFQFDAEDNYRDVFKEATCDEGCQQLADLMGAGDTLKVQVTQGHAAIDAKIASESGQAKASGKSPPKPTASKVSTQPTSAKASIAKSSSTTSKTPKANKSPPSKHQTTKKK